jgi:hypothetical protein
VRQALEDNAGQVALASFSHITSIPSLILPVKEVGRPGQGLRKAHLPAYQCPACMFVSKGSVVLPFYDYVWLYKLNTRRS